MVTKLEKTHVFMKGVFWTTYIGMAAYIFWPQHQTGAEQGYQASEMVSLRNMIERISVDDLSGTLDDNDGRAR